MGEGEFVRFCMDVVFYFKWDRILNLGFFWIILVVMLRISCRGIKREVVMEVDVMVIEVNEVRCGIYFEFWLNRYFWWIGCGEWEK